MEKQKVSVVVGSKKYLLTTDENPDWVRRVAALADRRLRETALATRQAESQAAVMALITMAEELIRSHDENARLRREINALREEMEDQ